MEKWNKDEFMKIFSADPELNRIIVEQKNLLGIISKRIIDLDDQNTRACLIVLGWKPPEKDSGTNLLDRRRLTACLEYCKSKTTEELEKVNLLEATHEEKSGEEDY